MPAQCRRIHVSSPVLVATAVVLLASTIWLGVVVVGQTQSLERNVTATQKIVNANVRTLGQVQRELLRMDLALERDPADPARLELQRSFVAQRMREATNSHQLQTLGTDGLRADAQRLAREWFGSVEPLISQAGADPSGSGAAHSQAIGRIEQLERGFLQLTTVGETNRKEQAGAANRSSSDLLASTRWLFAGLAVTLGLFAAVSGIALRSLYGSNRRRKATSRELEEVNATLRQLSEVASRTDNLVIITDDQGRFEWVNDAFVARTGYTLADVDGRRPGHVLRAEGTDPEIVAHMSERVAAGLPFSCEVLNQTRDGRPYWVAIDAQPVQDGSGRLTSFIAVEADITEQRETEDRLRSLSEAATRSAQAKSDFLASMSHEIRTPLNAVIGLNELLLHTDLSTQQREYVETSRDSGNLLLDLINDILSFSALESGEVTLEAEPFDLAELLSDTNRMFREVAAAKGLSLHHHVGTGLATWRAGDEVGIRQVLVNLVGNALKLTDTGGVEVRVDADPVDGAPDRIRVTVQDSGVGIPSTHVDDLLDPFSQGDGSAARRHGGTGLGLAICDRIITMMGGEIRLDSTPGVGTSVMVTVDLPEAPVDVTSVEVRPHVPRPVPDRGLRVLVAEDDPVNQLVARHLLEALGVTPDIVDNGAAACQAVRSSTYDIVLMDIHMPEMDGVEAARRIGADDTLFHRPRLVAMTANALAGDRERFLEAGLDDYVAKPVRLDDLARVLTRSGAVLSEHR